MPTDHELLRDYARHRSESAFAELVRRHVDMVYSAALRETHGDASLAEEITQAVFNELARKASKLCRHPALAGWLYTCVRQMTANVRRAEDRRQRREVEAHTMKELLSPDSTEADWRQMQPVLDDAMYELSEADRAVVVLRFFEDRSHTEVGLALGLTETAARKRVDRALEKLRSVLGKRGITSTASGLTAALAFGAVITAPTNLAASVAAGAVVATASTAASSFTLWNLVTMTKLQAGIIGAIVVAGVATPLVMQHQAQVTLRVDNEALRQQVEQLAPLITENERLSNLVARVSRTEQRATEPTDELLRLRAEVTRLRSDALELARLKTADSRTTSDATEAAAKDWVAKVSQLKQRLAQIPQWNIPELQYLTSQDWLRIAENAKLDTDAGERQAFSNLRSLSKGAFSRLIQRALHDYANANDGQLPTDVAQLKPYFKTPINEAVLERYEMLKTGRVSDLPRQELVVGEKLPVDDQMDTLYQIGMNGWQSRPIGAHKGVPP